MRFHYCTYFDKNYLYKGLALYRSLERHFPEFTLWILCFDGETYEVLDKLALPSVHVIRLEDFERDDEDLLKAKSGRTAVEYYWTCTPSLPLYVFRQEPVLDGVVYLDSDVFFYHDPSPLFEELGSSSILIHPHRYAPQNEFMAETSGIYNVGMIAFRNDQRGLECLRWWRDRCNEWCFYRVEDGKLGDQKYLDDWPQRFKGVAVSQYPGVGLAPWNIDKYKLTTNDDHVLVDGAPLVFYHFHSFRLLGRGLFEVGDYPITSEQKRLIYRPYLRELSKCIARVRRVESKFHSGYTQLPLKKYFRLFARRRLGISFK